MSNYAGPTNWQASTAYITGVDMIGIAARYFLCTTSGTSASAAPTWPTTFGASVADGSLVLTCVANMRKVWAASASYVTQPRDIQYPWPDQIVTAGGATGSPVVQCVVSGTSGSVQPTWSSTQGATVKDGTVYWATVGFS